MEGGGGGIHGCMCVYVPAVCVCIQMYMNNQVYRALLRKNEKGKKEKERKLQQPQRLRKI